MASHDIARYGVRGSDQRRRGQYYRSRDKHVPLLCDITLLETEQQGTGQHARDRLGRSGQL